MGRFSFKHLTEHSSVENTKQHFANMAVTRLHATASRTGAVVRNGHFSM